MTSDTDIRPELHYTKDHEWVRLEGNEATVGITAFAVAELGDITLVTFDVSPGDTLTAGSVFGTIESVKTLSDLFAPLSGEVLSINDGLDDAPELVNEDCWTKGWMLKIRCNAADVATLLDAKAYRSVIEETDD